MKTEKTSQYRGVHWHKRAQRFIAEITVDGIKREILRTKDEREAALAYDRSAVRVGYKTNILKPVGR
jgi:hypothetical protein